MARLTRRRRSLLLTVSGALLFLIVASVAAVRWGRAATYRPGVDVEGVTSDLDRPLPADHPKVTFTDVTRAAGITFRHFDGKRASWLPEDMGSGAAWADYDGDGWVDLVVANEVGSIDASAANRSRSPARLVLYHNDRNGTFSDVTDRSGIDFRGWGMAVAWTDYDNDGHADLLITSYGHNVLYHGNGDGTFIDRSAASGIGAPSGFWTGAAWGDYDRDGFVDLYVTGYVKFTRKSTTEGVSGKYDVENPASINPLAFPPERNLLFHNNRDGTFTERAAVAGVVDSAGRGLAASWVDLDEDGWPDLYVANDVSQNALYRNLGNGKFENVGEAARVSDYRSSMGIAVGDWDGDGDQDLFLTHWIAQGNALYVNRLHRADAPVGPKARLPLTFMDESDRVGLGQISLDYIGWATSFIDYDDDGKLDLFVVNGSTLQKRDDPASLVPMQSKLFWNRGSDDGFYDASAVSGDYFQKAFVGRGAAFADFDNDGDVDVFVVNHGGPGLLLRNDGGNRNHWVQVEARGTKSNRQGVGARLRVVAGGTTQVRLVGAQSPYLSQNSLVETFGLGAAQRVDTIEVTWPGGARDVRTDVAANQRIVVTEGEAVATATPSVSSESTAALALMGRTSRDSVQRFWVLYRQATSQRIAGETRLAAESYANALALNPRHEDVLYYSGSMRLELGDYTGAAEAWRRLLAVNPSSARTHSRLGGLFQCLDPGAPFQLDSAEWHLRRAHEINQEENGPLVHLGEVALLRGDLASAHRQIATVIATDTNNATAHFYRGYLAFKEGDESLARKELARVAVAKPTLAATHGVAGEGDTKRGSGPLRDDSERCRPLRERSQLDSASAQGGTVASRYGALDRVLKVARRRSTRVLYSR